MAQWRFHRPMLMITATAILNLSCAMMSADRIQRLSSGHVGCAPTDINISDSDAKSQCPSVSTWKASCNGHEFWCTHTCIAESFQTSCKEMLTKQEPAQSTMTAPENTTTAIQEPNTTPAPQTQITPTQKPNNAQPEVDQPSDSE